MPKNKAQGTLIFSDVKDITKYLKLVDCHTLHERNTKYDVFVHKDLMVNDDIPNIIGKPGVVTISGGSVSEVQQVGTILFFKYYCRI